VIELRKPELRMRSLLMPAAPMPARGTACGSKLGPAPC